MPRIIDDFEDGDLSEYSSDGRFSISGVSKEGNYGLELKSDQFSGKITSSSGLNYYPERGDTFEFYVRFSIESGYYIGFIFGSQGGGNEYTARITHNGIFLRKDGNNIGSSAFSPSNNEWYRFVLDWRTTITLTGYDSNGNQQSQASASDSSYSSGNIGWEVNNTGSFDTVSEAYVDYARTLEPDVPQGLSASATGNDIDLNWNSSTDADTYHIYRGTSSGNLSEIATTSSTSYTDAGLNSGTTYYYAVSASNSYAESDLSTEASATTTLTEPSNVDISIDTPTDGTATWTDNSGEDGFRVEVYEDGAFTSGYDIGANTETAPVTFSKSTDEIQIRVRAETSSATSDWTYSPTYATAISGVTVDAERDTEIDFSWSGGDQADEVHIYRAESTGSTLADYALVASPTTTPFTDTSRENGERYFYRAVAVYGEVEDEPSEEIAATTTVPTPVLDSLDTSTDREIALAWVLSDNSTDGNVVVERRRAGDGGSFSDVATLAADATTHTDTNLDDGERYEYRIRRETDHTSGTSDAAAAKTNLPAPTNAAVSSVTDDSADLAWTTNHNYGETRIDLRPTTPDGEPDEPWVEDATYALGVEAHTFDGLKNGEEYEWRVIAQTEHTETEDI